ncbi:hypothetical protein HAP48_0035240 [Bradyrhizobium septentrionale]|uniref:Uncharacterized protein n=1 Tax=Bradyrhizobium septentrionale TaxID=1404411 RepID=A0A974A1U2_9BRAD|nr:hypothetical protein [Bradyrhizobium septentrionale]UGY13790.1 hypothetical protein HAP48_0035240 [Bradyrhizobium septentrionale]
MTTKDFPFTDVVEKASKYIEAGHTVHQKFSCHRCGARQTMEVPNRFFLAGRCEECKAVTDIQARGCNYVLVTGVNKGSIAETIR